MRISHVSLRIQLIFGVLCLTAIALSGCGGGDGGATDLPRDARVTLALPALATGRLIDGGLDATILVALPNSATVLPDTITVDWGDASTLSSVAIASVAEFP
ncbi:MAG: hypothetical protein ABI743_15405, partial [bacterium]